MSEISITVSSGVGPQGPAGATGGTATQTVVNGLTGTITIVGSGITVAAGGTTITLTSAGGGAVSSVNGKVGAVTLAAVDVTAAAASHTHDAGEVTSGTFNIARIPTISYTALSDVPASFTPASHTHDASAIQAGTLATARLPIATATAIGVASASSGLAITAGGALSANVRSVAGRTGDVTLTGSDVSGVVTTLNSLSGAVEIAAGSNITVSAGGTTVTIASTASGGGVTSVAGVTGSVTLTAIGLATSTSGQVITLDARPVRTTPTAITASQNDYNPGAGDIFRISSGSTNTLNITGLATAAMAQEALFINVSTHTSSTIRFQHQNTNSIAAQRIVVPWAGDLNLAPNGGSVVVVRDTTDDRWRTA